MPLIALDFNANRSSAEEINANYRGNAGTVRLLLFLSLSFLSDSIFRFRAFSATASARVRNGTLVITIREVENDRLLGPASPSRDDPSSPSGCTDIYRRSRSSHLDLPAIVSTQFPSNRIFRIRLTAASRHAAFFLAA